MFFVRRGFLALGVGCGFNGLLPWGAELTLNFP